METSIDKKQITDTWEKLVKNWNKSKVLYLSEVEYELFSTLNSFKLSTDKERYEAVKILQYVASKSCIHRQMMISKVIKEAVSIKKEHAEKESNLK